MKKVAVIGASGLLGKALMTELSKEYEVIGTCKTNPILGLKQIDITKIDDYYSFLKASNPDIVVHASALTDLERCEHYPDEARALNSDPIDVLVDWALDTGARTVLISTDGVFNGEKGKYSENDTTSPINVYGSTKLQAEVKLLQAPYPLALRVAVLYSTDITGKKYLANTITKLRDNQPVMGATDLIRSPTLTEDIASSIGKLLARDSIGLYHVSGASSHSMYDAAKVIARVFGYNEELVKPILSTDIKINGVPSIVKRPADCSLDCAELARDGILMRTLEDGLKYVKSRI